MSRHRSAPAYGFGLYRVGNIGSDHYRICWTVDFYYDGIRGRFPRQFQRDTDEAGARRFCKRHNLTMPDEATND